MGYLELLSRHLWIPELIARATPMAWTEIHRPSAVKGVESLRNDQRSAYFTESHVSITIHSLIGPEALVHLGQPGSCPQLSRLDSGPTRMATARAFKPSPVFRSRRCQQVQGRSY
jgi:hypothetical protein